MSAVTITNRAGWKADDILDQYEDHELTEVSEPGDWYDLRFDGMGIGLAKSYDGHPPHGIVPKVGDTVRQFGRGFGYPVRGMAFNGVVAFYHSPVEEERLHKEWVENLHAEKRAKFEKEGRARQDADYAALPEFFQRRINKFRINNPDFRWEYEAYEMFCCTEAMKLVNHLGTREAVERYASLTWEEQSKIDKAAGLNDGHSGNTHGAAVALATHYLGNPENVVRMHGALAVLVGSEEYGCIPARLGHAAAIEGKA